MTEQKQRERKKAWKRKAGEGKRPKTKHRQHVEQKRRKRIFTRCMDQCLGQPGDPLLQDRLGGLAEVIIFAHRSAGKVSLWRLGFWEAQKLDF